MDRNSIILQIHGGIYNKVFRKTKNKSHDLGGGGPQLFVVSSPESRAGTYNPDIRSDKNSRPNFHIVDIQYSVPVFYIGESPTCFLFDH